MREKTTVGFIGAGRVGTLLGRACAGLGYDVVGFADRSAAAVRTACRQTGQRYRRLTAGNVAASSDVLFLTVPDREIARVFVQLRNRLGPESLVVHCSGYYGVEVFGLAAGEAGLETLAFHPMQAFPASTGRNRTEDDPSLLLRGCTFVLDGSLKGLRFGRRLVQQLEGQPLVLRGLDRPLYHTMCVFASNFQHALMEAAEKIARELALPRSRARTMLKPLMRATLESMLAANNAKPLTGPVRRGDADTIAGHLTALHARVPELSSLYAELTRQLVDRARRQGTALTELEMIKKVLDHG